MEPTPTVDSSISSGFADLDFLDLDPDPEPEPEPEAVGAEVEVEVSDGGAEEVWIAS